MKARPDGLYWVKDRRYGWIIARWNGAQSWWVLGSAMSDADDLAQPSGVVGDPRFEKIGARIIQPEEKGTMTKSPENKAIVSADAGTSGVLRVGRDPKIVTEPRGGGLRKPGKKPKK